MLAILVGPVHAQTDTGRIEGVITDSTNASVPGATATAVHVETNERFEATSNGDGFYVITPLKPGRYTLEVTASGFKKYERPDVVLQVSQIARIDAELAAGDITEVVEVTGGAPLIEVSSSSLSQVIEERKIVELPLNGRNFTQLATLVPGVNRGTIGGQASGAGNSTETFRQSENGGASISANGLREQNNNFQLDGIDNNESVVNTVVFFPPVEALQEFRVITSVAPAEFGRGGGAIINAVLKSGSNEFHGSAFYFHRNSAMDARPTFASRKEVFLRHQYGGTVGGPIWKDKTFFFVSYSALRQRLPVEPGNFVTVPTQLMRQGNFSELLDPTINGVGAPIQLVNPLTGEPIRNNIIPSNLLNPVGLALANAYPLPTRGGVLRNFEPSRLRIQEFDDVDARIDHRFNDNHTVFGRVSIARDGLFDAGRLVNTFQAGFGAGSNKTDAESAAINYTAVLSDSVVNEFRFGYISGFTQFLPINGDIDQNAQFGVGGIAGISTYSGISLIGAGNGTYFEYLGDGGEFRLDERTLQFSDAVTWTTGNHTMKFGATIIQRHIVGVPSDFAAKGFYFYSDRVATPGTSVPLGFTGYALADLIAAKTDFTVADRQDLANPPTTISWENGFFAQDDWRVNRRLTLNLGLRYEIYTPYVEEDDRLANYDPVTKTLILPNQGGAPRSTVDTDYNNFGPRIGAAIDVFGDNRTVIRGGYGLFYALDRGGVENQLTKNPPFFVQNFIFGGPDGSVAISDPILLPPAVDPLAPSIPNGNTIRYVPRDTENVMVHQYNVTFEHQLTDDLSVSAAYVGTTGRNLVAIVSQGNTFAGSLEGRVTSILNEARSRYNSLQLKGQLRPWHGLSFLTSYTFGKAKDNAAGPFPGPNVANRTTATDVDNLDLDFGATGYDVRHRFTFAGSYEFGDFDDQPNAVRYILRDWQVNTIVTLQSGAPFTVFGGFNRAAIIGEPYGDTDNPDRYLNQAAFVGSTGPSDQMERNSLYGPGYQTVDASIFRRVSLTERLAAEFRFEAFNLFNTPQYGAPTIFVGDPNLGRITNTIQSSERQLQLGLRLIF
jgi:hypothetical protein